MESPWSQIRGLRLHSEGWLPAGQFGQNYLGEKISWSVIQSNTAKIFQRDPPYQRKGRNEIASQGVPPHSSWQGEFSNFRFKEKP